MSHANRPTRQSGTLPAGLAFDPTTRVLSGTPTAAGSGTITVTATNSAGTADWTVTYAFAAATPTDQDITAEAATRPAVRPPSPKRHHPRYRPRIRR